MVSQSEYKDKIKSFKVFAQSQIVFISRLFSSFLQEWRVGVMGPRQGAGQRVLEPGPLEHLRQRGSGGAGNMVTELIYLYI